MLAPERLNPRSRTSARSLAFRRPGTQPAVPGQGGINQCFPSHYRLLDRDGAMVAEEGVFGLAPLAYTCEHEERDVISFR